MKRASDIKPNRFINRPSQQPLRGHQSHASDKLVERGAAAPRSGNRASKWYGATQIPYVVNAGSNRIDAINGSPPRSFGHDANGSVTNDGKNQYGYDVRGRLKQTISVLGTTGYEVNAQGERVRKTGPNGDRIYHYDRQGRLIGEGTALGQIDREYIYLHDLPVAVIVE